MKNQKPTAKPQKLNPNYRLLFYFTGTPDAAKMVVRRKRVAKWENECFAVTCSSDPIKWALAHKIVVSQVVMPS